MVITYWPLNNALIATYTLPYVWLIMKFLPPGSRVFLVTLTPDSDRGTETYRTTRAELRREGIRSVDFRYRKFGAAFLARLPFLYLFLVFTVFFRRIGVLHGWCTPGGAIGYLLSVFTGRTLHLDSFEPHAETMVETGTWRRRGPAFRILFRLEKKQLERAKHVICAAPGMMAYARQAYGVTRPERFVKPACVDLDLFNGKKLMNRADAGLRDDEVVCVYAGKFGGMYLEEETFAFFETASRHWPGRFRVLLLTGHSDAEIAAYCARARLSPTLVKKLFVPHHDVPRYMALADFGICPIKPVPTKKFGSPIKNGEYWAMGLPVVITPGISTDSALAVKYHAGAVLSSFDDAGCLDALRRIEEILKEPGHRERIRQVAVAHKNFTVAEKIYRTIYLGEAVD